MFHRLPPVFIRLIRSAVICLQHTAPFLQPLLSSPSRPGGVFVSSRCPSPTPASSCDFQACSATYNMMHHGACAERTPRCKCHCATKSGLADTVSWRAEREINVISFLKKVGPNSVAMLTRKKEPPFH